MRKETVRRRGKRQGEGRRRSMSKWLGLRVTAAAAKIGKVCRGEERRAPVVCGNG